MLRHVGHGRQNRRVRVTACRFSAAKGRPPLAAKGRSMPDATHAHTFQDDEDETLVVTQASPPPSTIMVRGQNRQQEPETTPYVDAVCAPAPPPSRAFVAIVGAVQAFKRAGLALLSSFRPVRRTPTFYDLMPPFPTPRPVNDTVVSSGKVADDIAGEVACHALFRMSPAWVRAIRLVSAFVLECQEMGPHAKNQGQAHFMLSRLRRNTEGLIRIADLRVMMGEVPKADFMAALAALEKDKLIALLPAQLNEVEAVDGAFSMEGRGTLAFVRPLIRL